MVLQPALVAAQPLFRMFDRSIQGSMRVMRISCGLKLDSSRQGDSRLHSKPGISFLKGDMAAYRAVEIFVHDTVERILCMRLERCAGIHVFP